MSVSSEHQQKRIVIVTHGPAWAPRVCKEAAALSEAGFRVMVLAGLYDDRDALFAQEASRGAKWQYEHWIDLRDRATPRALQARLVKRGAVECVRKFGVQTPHALWYSLPSMLRATMATRADFTIVHGEPGLWVGRELLRQGCRVGVDLEDWHSEDLPADQRGMRPIRLLTSLESELLSKCRYKVTTSHAMAEALGDSYDVQPPAVIYNTFPDVKSTSVTRDRTDYSVPSVHWFSQTIGPGRGLEMLFSALPLVNIPMQLHLRGALTATARDWIAARSPKTDHVKVFHHDLVGPTELPAHLAEHDIGLALEHAGTSRSRDLTITNKLFQYLQAGLAIVATDTSGQKEIARRIPAAFSVVPQSDPTRLAEALNLWLANPTKLAEAKQAGRQGYEGWFRWEGQAKELVELAAAACFERVTSSASKRVAK